jgi:hypothetical protein
MLHLKSLIFSVSSFYVQTFHRKCNILNYCLSWSENKEANSLFCAQVVFFMDVFDMLPKIVIRFKFSSTNIAFKIFDFVHSF